MSAAETTNPSLDAVAQALRLWTRRAGRAEAGAALDGSGGDVCGVLVIAAAAGSVRGWLHLVISARLQGVSLHPLLLFAVFFDRVRWLALALEVVGVVLLAAC